jgi:hypothetical protein
LFLSLSLLGCVRNESHVSVDVIDSNLCGISTSPCTTISQSIWNLQSVGYNFDQEISVSVGVYTNTAIGIGFAFVIISSSGGEFPVLTSWARAVFLLFLFFYCFFWFCFFNQMYMNHRRYREL